MKLHTISRIPPLIGAFALFAVSASAHATVHPTAAKTARTTLEDIRRSAADAAEHSDTYGREVINHQLSNTSQRDQIEAIRADVNRMGKDLALLEAERPNLEPWEREAVDQVQPELHMAAANATEAIDYFNAHGSSRWTVENEQTIGQLTAQTERIATTVKDYLKLAALREHEAKIARDLPVAGN